MNLRIAFIGFRHAHIFGMYKLLNERSDVTVCAACEEDPATRASLAETGVKITHDDYEEMLKDTPCDVIACGDYFGIRGERAVRALESGRHILSDKPICTTHVELDRIRSLTQDGKLRLGCMLDLGDLGPYIALRNMIRKRSVGEVHAITFWAQHPLLYGKRPMWFFEEGKHQGTINDLAIHGIDIVPWLTGKRLDGIVAARAWNAKIKQHPRFQDGAMLVFRLENGATVMGDVSYLSSDRHGYSMLPYWRFTISGTDGVLETACNEPVVRLWRHDTENVIEEPVASDRKGGYFEDFLAELSGKPNPDGLTTDRILESSRWALDAQQMADREV